MKMNNDKEWVYLMLLAKELGITKDEVRQFIHSYNKKVSNKKATS